MRPLILIFATFIVVARSAPAGTPTALQARQPESTATTTTNSANSTPTPTTGARTSPLTPRPPGTSSDSSGAARPGLWNLPRIMGLPVRIANPLPGVGRFPSSSSDSSVHDGWGPGTLVGGRRGWLDSTSSEEAARPDGSFPDWGSLMGERGGRRFRPPRPGSADAELDGRYLAWLRRAADDLSRRPPNAAGTAKSDAAQLAANAAAFREAYLAERREAYMRQHRPSAAAGAAASSSTAGANGAAQAGSYDDAADAFAAWSALNEAGYFEAHQNATAASGTAGTDASQAGPSPSAARPPDPTAVDGGYQGGGADGELRHRRR